MIAGGVLTATPAGKKMRQGLDAVSAAVERSAAAAADCSPKEGAIPVSSAQTGSFSANSWTVSLVQRLE